MQLVDHRRVFRPQSKQRRGIPPSSADLRIDIVFDRERNPVKRQGWAILHSPKASRARHHRHRRSHARSTLPDRDRRRRGARLRLQHLDRRERSVVIAGAKRGEIERARSWRAPRAEQPPGRRYNVPGWQRNSRTMPGRERRHGDLHFHQFDDDDRLAGLDPCRPARPRSSTPCPSPRNEPRLRLRARTSSAGSGGMPLRADME